MRKYFVIALAILIIGISACTTEDKLHSEGDAMMKEKDVMANEKNSMNDVMTEKGDSMMEKGSMDDSMSEKGDSMMEKDSMDDSMSEKGDSMMEKDTMDDVMAETGASMVAEDVMYKGDVLAGTTSMYLDFNNEDFLKAYESDKTIMLYFYAAWCPICRKEQVEVNGAFNELDDPSIIGFRVNYKDSDTDSDEKELAKKYGITYQHTKVILKNKERLLKAPDSWDQERYVEELTGV